MGISNIEVMSLSVFFFFTLSYFFYYCSIIPTLLFTHLSSLHPHLIILFLFSLLSLSSRTLFHYLSSNHIPHPSLSSHTQHATNTAATTMDPNLTSTPGTPTGGQIHFVTPTNRWLGSIPLSTLDPLTLEPLSTYVRPDPRHKQGGDEKGGGQELEKVGEEREDMKERTTNIAGKFTGSIPYPLYISLAYTFFWSHLFFSRI